MASIRLAVAVMFVILPCVDARGAETKLKDTARALRNKHQAAVIRVKITSVPEKGGDLIATDVRTGTVLTAEGITATSLTPDMSVEGDYKVKSVEMTLADGRKVEAKLVGFDKELDLAFIAPAEKMSDLAHLAFPKGAKVDLLDEVLLLYRLPESNRLGVYNDRVFVETDKQGPAVVEAGGSRLGAPVFDDGGRPIGILTGSSSSTNPATRETVIRSGEVIEAALKRAQKK